METIVQNYAFISYSHQDVKIAKWLQHKLEQFYIPNKIFDIVNKDNLPKDSHYLRPIFLDKTDLNGGVLADTLRQNLESSRYLIVICSPNSAKSDWVSKEVQCFVESGRLDYIIPFVVKGTPFVDTQIAAGKNPAEEECMPKYLVEFTKKHPEKELLGIDVRDNGYENSIIRIVSRMLGISFDDLWDRQRRRRVAKITSMFSAFILFFFFIGYFFMPMKLTYTISNAANNQGLPMPEDAMVTIEGTSYNLGSVLDTTITLKSRPGYYRGRKLPVIFHATYYDTINTVFNLGRGIYKDEVLFIKRDNTFAVFAGHIIDQDGEPIAGASVTVRQIKATTDEEGAFHINLPSEEQAEEQAIIIEKAGYYDIYRPDECSSDELIYIMYKEE